MDKPVSSLIDRQPVTVLTEDTLDKVESVLDKHGLTFVAVLDMHGAIFGIITAHDLLHFHATKRNPKLMHAWEICTHRPIEVPAGQSVIEVAKLMVKRKIHHVLVTENGALLGVVSSFDLVEKYLLDGVNFGSEKPQHIRKTHSAMLPNSYRY